MGLIVGMSITVVITYIAPQKISAVNKELVKHGMAHYDKKTGKCIWNIKE